MDSNTANIHVDYDRIDAKEISWHVEPNGTLTICKKCYVVK
jgi:hypothetical protein